MNGCGKDRGKHFCTLARINNTLNSRHSAHCCYSIATFIGEGGIEKRLRLVENRLVESFALFMVINNWLQQRLSTTSRKQHVAFST